MTKAAVYDEAFIEIPASIRGIILKDVKEINLVSFKKEGDLIILQFKVDGK